MQRGANRRPRVSVSNCFSHSEPLTPKRSRSMTQLPSIVGSEHRILRHEGSFETTLFASGLRRRRFIVRSPAQPPNGSQRALSLLERYPGPCSASHPPIVACNRLLSIKLSSLHTHPRPTPTRDLLLFFPDFVRPSRSLLSLQSCRAVARSSTGSSTTSPWWTIYRGRSHRLDSHLSSRHLDFSGTALASLTWLPYPGQLSPALSTFPPDVK